MDPRPQPTSDPPQPSGRNTGRAIAALIATLAIAAVAIFAMTQLPQFAAEPSPEASPSTSPSTSPAPSPTASGAAPSPSPGAATPSPSAATGELPTGPSDGVMSFTPACDVVPPVNVPATTVVADGRVVWRGDDGRLLVRQLTPASLDDFREQIRSTGLFDASASYELERRPGTPEPPGHGVCVWNFVWHDEGGEEVEVSSIGWLGDEEEAMYYEPSPERETLHALAEQLMAPDAWYDDEGWVQPEAVAFEPEDYLVLASVTVPQLATQGAPDFDDVSWPFDQPPDEFGVGYGSADPPSRCDQASTPEVDVLAGELAAAGVDQFEESPYSGAGAALPWAARNAAVDMSFWPMLPDGRPACAPDG